MPYSNSDSPFGSSSDSSTKLSPTLSRLPGAPLNDRMLAFAFDLCLWFPLAILVTKPFWRDFQYLQMTSPNSTEAILSLSFGLVGAALFIILVQSLVVWKFGTTPGKKLFQISIVSTIDQKRLSLGNAFTRSFSLLIEILCFGLPWLEVLSHPDRRPWHDRLAESEVVTHKKIIFEGPHWLEQRFFRNLYWGSALTAIVFIASALINVRHQVSVGVFKRIDLENSGYLCEQVSPVPRHPALEPAEARLDYALALFSTGQLSQECLESEADFVFWTQNEKLMSWGHLIRGVLAQAEGKEAKVTADHFQLACPTTDATSAVCRLSADLSSVARSGARNVASTTTIDLAKPDVKSYVETWSEKVRFVQNAAAKAQFEKIHSAMKLAVWPRALVPYIQEQSLKSYLLEDQLEKFKAGSEILRPGSSVDDRQQLAAWACFSENAKACGGVNTGRNSARKEGTACKAFREDLNQEAPVEWSREATLTLGLDMLCTNKRDAAIVTEAFRQFEDDERMTWFLRALKNESASAPSTRPGFEFFAKSLEGMPKTHWARNYLLWWSSRAANNEKDFQKLSEEFARSRRDDLGWWVAYDVYLKNAPQDLQQAVKRGLSSVQEEK